jgi:hypothetical protein
MTPGLRQIHREYRKDYAHAEHVEAKLRVDRTGGSVVSHISKQ